MLPDVLYLIGIPPNEAFCEVLICTLDRFGVPFKSPFTPSDDPLFGLNADKEPTRGDTEHLEAKD